MKDNNCNGIMLSGSSESVFEFYYLGMIQNVNLGMHLSQKSDVLLIDKIEEDQLEGKIRLIPTGDDRVLFAVSEHGIRVTDFITKDIIQRHSLHTVAELISYTDAYSKSNIVLKTGQVGRRVFDCYLFQCSSEEQALRVSQRLTEVFNGISELKL